MQQLAQILDLSQDEVGCKYIFRLVKCCLYFVLCCGLSQTMQRLAHMLDFSQGRGGLHLLSRHFILTVCL